MFLVAAETAFLLTPLACQLLLFPFSSAHFSSSSAAGRIINNFKWTEKQLIRLDLVSTLRKNYCVLPAPLCLGISRPRGQNVTTMFHSVEPNSEHHSYKILFYSKHVYHHNLLVLDIILKVYCNNLSILLQSTARIDYNICMITLNIENICVFFLEFIRDVSPN